MRLRATLSKARGGEGLRTKGRGCQNLPLYKLYGTSLHCCWQLLGFLFLATVHFSRGQEISKQTSIYIFGEPIQFGLSYLNFSRAVQGVGRSLRL